MEGRLRRTLWIVMILFFSCSGFGCVGVGAHLMYWLKGTRVEAEYKGLEGKRVAVICMSDAAPYGPDVSTQILSRQIRRKLARSIKKIKLVSRSEIESWTDTNNWDQIDYLEIGRGLDADVVIAVELSGYSLEEGAGLFKGSTTFSVQVFDLNQSSSPREPVYTKGPVDYSFPGNHPIPATQGMSTAKFEQMFMIELGEKISQLFCGYDMPDSIARDAASNRH